MKRSQSAVVSLCLSLMLSPLVAPLHVMAADFTPTSVVATSNNPAATPIGTIESTGAMLINGRAANGKNVIWDGELLQAPADTSAAVTLEALGQVKLSSGSLVRLSAASNTIGNTAEQAKRMLVAAVYNGQIEVELQPAASAYLEAAGKAWLAAGNTKLTIGIREGAAILGTVKGIAGEMGSFAINLPALKANKVSASTPEVKAVALAERASLLRSIKLVTGTETRGAVKLYSNHKAGMIGMVESGGTVKINGREARRQELLWDGEIVQAPVQAGAQLSLAGLGQVQLTKGSIVKLTTASASNAKRVLTASVLQGEINVKLQPEIAAYIETNGKSFAADAGSRFRVNGRDGNSVVEVFAGNVREIGSWNVELSADVMEQTAQRNAGPRQYHIRPLTSGEKAAGYLMNVKAQSTQTLRFLVTDLAGKAVAGVPVVFTLNVADGQPVGMLGTGVEAGKYFETKTDTQGVAVVPFNAGSATGSTSLSAAVRGTTSANANVVVVDDDDDKFWTKRNAIPVFTTAAAAIVAGIVIYHTREERLPIQGTGPTQIVP
jgi:hypothetical protein